MKVKSVMEGGSVVKKSSVMKKGGMSGELS